MTGEAGHDRAADPLRHWGPRAFLLYWAVLLTISAVVLITWDPAPLEGALLPAAAAATFVLVLGMWLRPERGERVRALPDLSLATPALAAGIALTTVGLMVAGWLAYLGAGAVVAALAILLRELATQWAARR